MYHTHAIQYGQDNPRRPRRPLQRPPAGRPAPLRERGVQPRRQSTGKAHGERNYTTWPCTIRASTGRASPTMSYGMCRDPTGRGARTGLRIRTPGRRITIMRRRRPTVLRLRSTTPRSDGMVRRPHMWQYTGTAGQTNHGWHSMCRHTSWSGSLGAALPGRQSRAKKMRAAILIRIHRRSECIVEASRIRQFTRSHMLVSATVQYGANRQI